MVLKCDFSGERVKFSSKLLTKSGVNQKKLAVRFPVSPIPNWELCKAKFDYNCTTTDKPLFYDPLLSDHLSFETGFVGTDAFYYVNDLS